MTDRDRLVLEPLEQLTIEQACQLCSVEVEFFHALVAEGVFDISRSTTVLLAPDLVRLRKAARLHLDLDVNPPGIALVLDLLELRQ